MVALIGAVVTGGVTFFWSSRSPRLYESRARVQFVQEELYEYRDGERDRLVGLLETPDIKQHLADLHVTSVSYGIPDRQTFIDVRARASRPRQASEATDVLARAMVDRSKTLRSGPLKRQISMLTRELAKSDPRIATIDTKLEALYRTEGQAEARRYLGTPADTVRLTIQSRRAQKAQGDLSRQRDALLDSRTGSQRRLADAKQQLEFTAASMRVVRRGDVPTTPVSPRPVRDASVVGFLAAVAIAGLGGLRSSRRSSADAERSPVGRPGRSAGGS